MCKLASLTAGVAPVKSPKDHVATRRPGTPKVHHGTQRAVQVVVHRRNTRASSRKECATCTILGRHFERVSVPAHVRDKYKILMADREFAVVSGHTRRLFARVCFHFWQQRRHHTCILFLSCKLPRNRSRQNSREPKRQTSVSSLLVEYDLKSRENQVANLKLSLFFSLQGDKSTASTLCEGPFCSLQNILHVITHEGNFMRANQVCVW